MNELFNFREDEASRSWLFARLRQVGFAHFRSDETWLRAEAAEHRPWRVAERLFGALPELVEFQPIRPVPAGRSFASNTEFTPPHSDSQRWAGRPPQLQVMLCERAANVGGEAELIDTWQLLRDIRAKDPQLFTALFSVRRRIPFVFGDFHGPTVSRLDDSTIFTHSPISLPNDRVARALEPHLQNARRSVLAINSDEVMVVNNHRMLHGRRAFSGSERHFSRLLVWQEQSLAGDPELTAFAQSVANLPEESEVERLRRRAILAMLRGEAPGKVAERFRIPEPELYRLRDRALAALTYALRDDFSAR